MTVYWLYPEVLCACRPKAEAEAPKEPVAKPGKNPEAVGSERGLDELMLLAHSRHLSEEPEAPAGQPGAPAAQAAPSDRAESAEPAKSEEVCSAVRHLPTQQSSCASGSAMPLSQHSLAVPCGRALTTWVLSLQAMAQEEADAVAALMAAASGDVRNEPEQPPEEEGSPPGRRRLILPPVRPLVICLHEGYLHTLQQSPSVTQRPDCLRIL